MNCSLFTRICPVSYCGAQSRSRISASRALNPPLGRCEAEAIKLAQEIGADLLLTDDRKARAAATQLGIKSSGVLGLVVHAKKLGRVSSVRDAIEVLEKRGGLYLSDAVKVEALKLAGE